MEIEVENHVSRMEQPPSPFKASSMSASPQPLQPLSSERQNQQRIPQSPSLPSNLDGSSSPRKAHQHRLSDAADVKARVAYLNAIAQTGSPTRSASPTKSHALGLNNAAIQRALIGREEAEGALAALSAQIESYKARERLSNERIDHLQNQINEARSRQKHERTVYEKEIKLNKKAEFKAEMAVIKLQEDLREVRTELEGYKARSEHEKAEKEKARQEAFERAYAIAGMTEELQDLKQRLEVAVQERDAAVATVASKVSMQNDDTSQIEMMDAHDIGEKRKQPMPDVKFQFFDEEELLAPDCPLEMKYAALQTQVNLLLGQVQKDQELIHMMNMECQFKICPCRRAEREGVRFVHDYEYDAKMRARNAKKRKVEGLEPQLPLPVFKSFLQKREEARAKQQMRPHEEVQRLQKEETQQEDATTKPEENEVVATEPDVVMEEPGAPLPPANIELLSNHDLAQSPTLTEAANIPLPSLKPMELDPSDEMPEPTAQLEELTQVLVKQGDNAQNFLFSMSMTSNKAVPEPASIPKQSHEIRMSDDLFNISPPKRQMPPRPSTAMGVLTVDSPIRLVPHSPQVFQPRSTTPGSDTAQPRTTRVALNDTSPVRQARQQRHQHRQDVGERVRGRSPGPIRSTGSAQPSPAQNTLSPVTPVVRQERIRRHHAAVQPRPQTAQDHYPSTRKEISTTTTVPLRNETKIMPEASTSASSDSDPHTTNRSSASGTPFSVPGTPNMTREQALAQIRARRDRARSINMRKSAEEGSKTPGSVARRGVNLKDRLGIEGNSKGRDFSQASAPGRI